MAGFTPEQIRAELERRGMRVSTDANPPAFSREEILAELSRRKSSKQGLDGAPDLEPIPQASAVEAAARGAGQGMTFGFLDELIGAGKAAAMPAGRIGDTYREERDASRAANEAASRAHPYAYTAGEIGGGIASALIPGVGIAARGVGAAIKTGAAAGAVAGLGSSKSDMTEGDVGGAARDTAIGGVVGGAGGAVAHGAGRVLLGAGRRLSAAAQAARTAEHEGTDELGGFSARYRAARETQANRDAAQRAAREAAGTMGEREAAGNAQTRATFLEQSRQLEQQMTADLGERFQLRPSQALADTDAALAESASRNLPGPQRRAAQSAKMTQLDQSARWLDMQIQHVASDPSRLGSADVSDQLAGTVERHMRDLVEARSATAGPLYLAASEAAGGRRIIPTDATRAAMSEILDANKFAPGKIAGQIRSSLGKIQDAATKNGRLSLDDVQNLRSLWGQAARGDVTIVEGLSEANQRRLARNVLAAIDRDLDSVSEGIASRDAIGYLRAANDAWRRHSQAIDETATETVERVLKMARTDGSDTITKRLLSSSPEQIGGVFRVLNRADPAAAQQVRAQILDELLTTAGKPRAGTIAAEEGAGRLKPQTALTALIKSEPQLRAAFAGDNRATMALRNSYRLLRRLSFGPGIEGSPTAPWTQQSAMDAAGEAASAAAESAAASTGGPVAARGVRWIGDWIRGVTGDNQALARIYSTPDGIEVFNEALRAQLSGRVTRSTSTRLAAAIGNVLGLQVGDVTGGSEP